MHFTGVWNVQFGLFSQCSADGNGLATPNKGPGPSLEHPIPRSAAHTACFGSFTAHKKVQRGAKCKNVPNAYVLSCEVSANCLARQLTLAFQLGTR